MSSEQTDYETFMKWLIAGIIAIFGLVAAFFRWMMARHDALMNRQDEMHTANQMIAAEARRDAIAREERLMKRADDQSALNSTQVLTLQKMNDRLDAQSRAIEDVPKRVVDEIEKRK